MASVVRRNGRDIWGLACLVAALLVAGSVWFSAVGVVGDVVDQAFSTLLGLVRMALPVGLTALGVVTIRSSRRGARSDAEGAQSDRGDESLAPSLVGGALLVICATGLLHLARGRPGIGSPSEELGAAGGVVGVAVGGFLHAWTAIWGSTLLLVFAGLVGVIVMTPLTLNALGRGVIAMARPMGKTVSELVSRLFADVPDGASQPSAEGSQAPPAVPQKPPQPQTGAVPPSDAVAVTEKSSHASLGAPAKASRSTAAPARNRGASKWKLPPLKLLAGTPSRQVDYAEALERGEALQATLSRFDVPTTLLEPVVGPTVTRFVLELGEGVKVAKLESLRKDIAYSMASADVRILAPIPGQRAIGVEVPNIDRQVVRIGDVLRSAEASEAANALDAAIGRDINGHSILLDLSTTPHLLIAGATGAGKSSCLNSLITSVLMRSTPDDVRMILVDPKRVEMGQYDRVPHLLTAPVTDPRKAANALAWAVTEMERRYDLLHDTGFRDISGYNAAVDDGNLKPPPGARGSDGEEAAYQRLPFVLVVVDELADLMMVAARDVEESIARLAQMARAVGIHLVIATQRPSVNVITGVIKANIPARLAFAVSSLTDSRVILDQPGAERLVGQGDMLWLSPSSSTPHRIQGCWVTEAEVRSVVAHWVDQAPEFRDDPSVSTDSAPSKASRVGEASGATASSALDAVALGASDGRAPDLGGAPIMSGSITDAPPPGSDDGGDELLDAAMTLVVEAQLGSTSMLQRRLRVGFARAGRIMDLLEQRGVVGPSTGSKARDVLITAEELEARRAE